MTHANGQEPTLHPVHFAVDASVIFQLGEHLITDAVQALVELIKNGYDADASQVLVEVDTSWTGKGPSGIERLGQIVVSDDGVGMTTDVLKNGWLTLSRSSKGAFKREGRLTARGRTPLGEKGLGRLGAQRLGHDIEIVTIPQPGGTQYRLAYSWDVFSTAQSIENVELQIEERESTDSPGTWITISGLKSLDTWTDAEARKRLEESLSQLVSPYSNVADFQVDVQVDQSSLELSRITASVLTAADIHYDINYRDGVATFTGRAKLGFFRPASGGKLRHFNDIVGPDHGRALYAFLRSELANEEDEKAGLRLRRPDERSWFVEFSKDLAISTIKPATYAPSATEPLARSVADPGPFTGAVDAFDLGNAAREEQTAFDSRKAFSDYVKRFSGIRVYRDGFGVRVDRDWLGLAETSTSGASYYGLRPYNTLGYVAISARANPELLEKTDREGFQLTPHYENFFKLLRDFVAFTEYAQTQLRRAYNNFATRRLASEAGATEDTSPAALAERIRSALGGAARHRQTIHAESQQLKREVAVAEEKLRAVADQVRSSSGSNTVKSAVNALQKELTSLRMKIDAVEASLGEVDEFLESLGRVDVMSVLLGEQVASLENRLGDLYEAAGLGITAEALSHELAHVVDRLQSRANQLIRAIKAKRDNRTEAGGFAEFVLTSVHGLRYQLSHLAPSLRYARDSKDIVRMSRFVHDLAAYHSERLQKAGIILDVETRADGDFNVNMNRGKLTQVFDNLILNSEYWISRMVRRGTSARILIRIDQPFVYVTDTGPGIDPVFEASLFQPFVSGKPRGEGRGLGLFIIEQLLAMDGCTIGLSTERNDQGRRSTFEINFVEALNGSE